MLVTNGEDKWSWSSASDRNQNDDRNTKTDYISNRRDNEFNGKIRVPTSNDERDSYEVKESTTRRPDLTKPNRDEYGNNNGFGWVE